LCALKSGICSIKSDGKQYKISEIQVFVGTALYLLLPENILLSACIFLPNCCFFVSSVPLPVEAGYGCSFSVASNVFVRTKPYLLFLNKNNAPHECGNPKCKVIASGWLSEERFPRDHRHQPAASLAAQDSGRAKALGVRRQCRTAPTGLRRARRRSIVKAVALYTN
jgi:hypothetical protein